LTSCVNNTAISQTRRVCRLKIPPLQWESLTKIVDFQTDGESEQFLISPRPFFATYSTHPLSFLWYCPFKKSEEMLYLRTPASPAWWASLDLFGPSAPSRSASFAWTQWTNLSSPYDTMNEFTFFLRHNERIYLLLTTQWTNLPSFYDTMNKFTFFLRHNERIYLLFTTQWTNLPSSYDTMNEFTFFLRHKNEFTSFLRHNYCIYLFLTSYDNHTNHALNLFSHKNPGLWSWIDLIQNHDSILY
jgi:hypothetical protein